MKALAFVTLFLGASMAADPVSLPDTKVEAITATANGVHYKLYVGLPADYSASDARYPVLYLLDADYSFPIARTIVKHLSERERLEEIIVVGIACDRCDQYQSTEYRLNRTRDYTPRFSSTGGYGPEYQKVSGGGPKFLEFIRTQLFPWMDEHYRTNPSERGLVGHSYGGLFATWVLLTAPDTFSRYIIVSPSLWYADRFIFGLKPPKTLGPARVYMAVGALEGNSEHDMVVDLRRMAKELKRYSALSVADEVFDAENHDSVFPTAVARGIRFVFKPRREPEEPRLH